MKEKIKVSIVIPTYNRPQLLERLLKSIVAQTFKQYEVIVVDDRSPNEKAYSRLISKYKKKIKRFRYFRNKINKGAPFCRNFGILKSKFRLIALTDDDDEWKNSKLKNQTEVYKKTKYRDLIYTWSEVNVDGIFKRPWKSKVRGEDFKKIMSLNFIPSSSVLVEKSSILKAGLFDEKLRSCQDWDMWIRMFQTGSKCDFVPSFEIIYYISTAGSITSSSSSFWGYGILAILKKHFWSLKRENLMKAIFFAMRMGLNFMIHWIRLIYRSVRN